MTQLVAVAGFGANGVRRSREALLRKALFASTALVAVTLASPALAQVTVNPAGGGTVVSDSGTPADQTAGGGGVRISNISGGSGVTVSGVTINQTVTGPTANALSLEVPSGGGGLGVTFNGANSISTTVTGGAAVAISNTGNLGVGFTAGSTFTGSYGFNISNPNGFVSFNSQAQTLNIVASGTALTGIRVAALLNPEVYLGASTISGFATGIYETTTDTRALYALVNSTGGSISASQIGIQIAPGPASTGIVQSQWAIIAPTGIQVTGGGGAIITTSGGGTIDSTSAGTGTGIIASSSAGANPVSITVGASIGATTSFLTAIDARITGGTGAITITNSAGDLIQGAGSASNNAIPGGINAVGPLTLSNAGAIVSTAGNDIALSGGGTINNGDATFSAAQNTASRIEGKQTAISGTGSALLTVNNYGRIIGDDFGGAGQNNSGGFTLNNFAGGVVAANGGYNGTYAYGAFAGGGALTVANAGLITSKQYAVYGSNTADMVTNSGTIEGGVYNSDGTVTAGGVNAINLTAGGTVMNNAGGVIVAGTNGVSATGALSLTNAATAKIVGGTNGVTITGGAAKVSNSGTIDAGTYNASTGVISPGAVYAISLSNGGSVTNSGTIQSGSAGIYGNSATALLTVVNTSTGTITTAGTGNDAVSAQDAVYNAFAGASTTVLNAGTIQSGTHGGIGLVGGGTVTNAASGTSIGGNGQYGAGVNIIGATTVNNYGSLTGSGTVATGIRQHDANVTTIINLFAGSTTGTIVTAGGNDSLTLYNGRGTAGAATTQGYTDAVSLAAGTVTLQNAGTLAAAIVGAVNLGGGTNTLTLAGTGDGTSANGVVGTLDVTSITNVTKLVKQDGGTWMVTGTPNGTPTTPNPNLNFSGGASVLAGTLAVETGSNSYSSNALGSGAVAISGSATVRYDNPYATGSLGPSSGQIYVSSNQVTGTGTLAFTGGAGSQTVLDHHNSSTEDVALSAGGLIAVQSGAVLAIGTGVFVGNQARLDIASGASFDGASNIITIDALTGGGTYTGTGTLQIGVAGGSGTFNGTIANEASALSVTKTGAGTETLTGTGTYTGGTTISAGRLVEQNTGAALGTGTVSISGVATLELANTNTATALPTVVIGPSTLTGTGTLVKSGTGYTAFGGNGAVNVNLSQGALIDVQAGLLAGSSSFQGIWTNNQASLNVASGATFNGVEGAIFVDALMGSGTVLGGQGGVAKTTTVGVANGSGTFAGVLGDFTGDPNSKLALTKTGTGTQTLTGVNTYTGQTAISGGTLALSGSGSIANSATVVNFGSFDISGRTSGTTVNQLSSTGTIVLGANTLTANETSAQLISGVISGSGGFTKSGAGNLTLSGANTYTGTTTIGAGTLTGTTASIVGSSIVDNGTLAFVQAASGTFTPGISGSGGVTVSGLSGTNVVTFAGALTQTGGFTVSGASNVTLTGSYGNGANNAPISSGTGIFTNLGTVRVTGAVGSTNGIFLLPGGTLNNGDGTHNQASLIATDSALIVNAGAGAGVVTVSNAGLLEGLNYEGVTVRSGSLSLTNAGTGVIYARGTQETGTAWAAGTDTSGVSINIANNGGQIVGRAYGVRGMTASDIVTNTGTIASGTWTAPTAGAVYSTGTIAVGGTAGVNLTAGGAVTNSGTIEGAVGVSTSGGSGQALTVTNNNGGLVYATSGVGVYQHGAGALSVTNAAGGRIVAIGGDGVHDDGFGLTTIVNDGTIVGNASGLSTNGAIDITNTGLIGAGTLANGTSGAFTANGQFVGISTTSGGTVRNNGGSIQGGGAQGIVSSAGLTVTNGGASLTAAQNTASVIMGTAAVQSGAALNLTNYGMVTGTSATQAGVNATGATSVVTNYGTVQGGTQAVVLNSGGTVYNYGTGSVLKATTTTAYNEASGVYSNGALILTNQGAISTASTGTSYGVEVIGVGTITNSGSITAASRTALSTTGANSSVTNQTGGNVVGATGGISATGTISINNAGMIGAGTLSGGTTGTFTANGNTAIAVAGGTVENTSGAMIGGALTSSAALTLNTAGSMNAVTVTGTGNSTISLRSGSTTGVVTLGSGDDGVTLFTGAGSSFAGVANPLGGTALVSAGVHDAATVTSLALGTGTNTVTLSGGGTEAAVGATVTGQQGSLGLDTVSGLSVLTKTGTGTWVLSGAATGTTAAAAINAGIGGAPGSGGLLQFNGTAGLTGAIGVNGAKIQALTAGAFGSGTITTIDPTVEYSATGAYGNAIVLATTSASDPTRLEADANVTATLTGNITSTAPTMANGVLANQAVVFDGGGTIALSGANSWTGLTTISNGSTLSIAAATNVGTGGFAIGDAVTAGTLATTNTGAITLDGAVALGAGVATVGVGNAAGNTTLSGVVSGAALSKTGAGTLSLSGSETYTGTTTISAGTLALTGTGSIASSSGVVATGTLDISGHQAGFVNVKSLSGNGTVATGGNALQLNNASGTFSGVITGTQTAPTYYNLSIAGGTETLTGVNTYTGFTAIGSGATLALGGTGSIANSSNVGIFGTLDISGHTGGVMLTAFNDQSTLAGTINLGANTLTTGSVLFYGTITGTGGFAVANGFGGDLYAVSSYTGATTIGAGARLNLDSGASIATSSGVLDNGTLDISAHTGGTTIGALSGSGGVTMGANTLTLASGGTYGGVASGTGGLTVTAGNEILTGNNAYTGATTISGGNLTLGNGGTTGSVAGAIALNAGTLTVNRSNAVMLAGAISGGGSFVQAGSGTTTLSGTNTYTGTTTVSAGTLALSGGEAIADTSAVSVAGGATLSLLSSETIGSLAGAGAVTLGANTLTLASGATTTFSGVASGTGGMLKQGGGTLTLSGANSFTGTLEIAGGTVAYGANNVLADTATVLVDAGATFNLNGYSDTIGTLNLYGTLSNGGLLTATTYNAFAGSVINQAIGTTGALNVYGNTALNAATNAAPVTIFAGALTTSGPDLLTDAGAVSIASSGSLVLGGKETVGSLADATYMGSTGGGAILLGGGVLTVGGANTTTMFSGQITGTAAGNGLTKTGTGTLTLSGTNIYTGATTINAGTLALSGGSALADDNVVTVNATGTLSVLTSETIGNVQGTGNVALANGTALSLGAASGSFGGTISGAGGLTLMGGTLALTGGDTYAGTTMIGGGTTLALAGTGSIANSAVADAGTFDVSGLGNGGTSIVSLSGAGIVTLGANTMTLANAAGTFSGAIGGTGGLTLTAGTETLSGTNTYTGATTINGGTLTLSGGAALADANTVTLNAGGTLALASSETIGNIAGNGGVTLNGGTVLGVNMGSGTFAGTMSGAGGFMLAGGALTLSGANSYAGTTTIVTGATLTGTSASFSPNSAVTDNGTLAFAQSGSGSFAQTISGSGTVTVAGLAAGNLLTFTGTNTQAGGFQVTDASTTVFAGANSGAVTEVALQGASRLVNTGSIVGTTTGIAASAATGTTTIVNAATGTISGGSYAVQGSGAGALTLVNYGTLGGAVSALSTGANTLSLRSGSTTGAVTTGTGNDALSLYTGAVTTVPIVNAATGVTVQAAGTYAAAVVGAIDLGAGNNVLNLRGTGDGSAANGAAGSIDLSTVANAGTITKQDAGTWTLGGAVTDPVTSAATINAGIGGTPGSGGLLVFAGSGLTGTINVNGAIIRATQAGAFGTGTINTIDPTVQYAASGTYANAVVLQSTNPANDPTTLQTYGTGIIATLTGAITEANPPQPLVFSSIDANGNVNSGTFVLTNAGNAWTGITTVAGGMLNGTAYATTLQGTTATISGGSITDNGAVNFNQIVAGTNALAISGAGVVQVNGGGNVSLTGALTTTGGVQIGTGGIATLSNASGNGNTVVTLTGANAVLNVAQGGQVAATNGGAVFGVAQNGTVTNAGTIGSTGNFSAIYFNPNLGTATVTNTGTVSAVGSAVYSGAGTVLTVNNTGMLTSVNRPAVFAAGAANVTNGAGGTINGFFGVYANGALTLANAGQITAAGAGGNAVTANGGGTIVNTGTVSATTQGGWGVQMSGAGTVDNQGTINADSGLVATTGTGVSFSNEGTITGLTNGVLGYNGTPVVLTNSGTITGGAYGVQATAAGSSITNNGTIAGSASGAIGVAMAGGTLANRSGGTISAGQTNGVYGTAIQLSGTGNVLALQAGSTVNGSIDASATTDGSNGYTFSGALNGGFTGGSGNDTVTLVTPVTVTGPLDGGAGTDTLVLDGTGAGTLGSAQVANFENGVKQGSGTWTLTGTTAASPTVFAINAGTLAVAGGNALADTSAITIASAGTLQLNASETIGSLSGAGNVTLGANTLTTGGLNASPTFSGVIAGSGGLTKVGTGTLTLSGANTYTGATMVNAGTLALGASNVIADASAVGVATGATLNLGANSDTVASIALSGTLAGTGTLTAATYTLNGGTVNANLGAGTLTQAGGASVLNGTAGAASVNVNGGTLALGASNRLADNATVMIANGAILDLGANSDTVGLVGIAGTLNGTGTLTAAEYDLSGATVNANLGAGNLFQVAGISTLNGTAGAANVTVNAGTLVLGASNRLADAAAVAVATGATLNLGANSDTVGTLALNGTLSGTGTLTASTYTLNNAAVNANLGTGTLVQAGGTSVLSGMAATGTVAVMAGTLRLGASDRIADTAMLGVASGATFDLAGYNETVGTLAGSGTLALGAGTLSAGGTNADYAFGGNVTGTGDLTKVGTGTFSLIGNEGVTGRLNVNAGTLMLAGTTAGSVRVQGGTLTGASAIAGNLLLSSGTLSPGIATQPVAAIQAGSLTVTGGTTVFDFGGMASGFTADLLKVTGAATLTGGTVTTRGLDGSANYKMEQTYTVLTSGALTGTYASGSTFTQVSNNSDLYYRLRYDLVANGVVLEVRKPVDFTTTLGTGATGNQLAIAGALNGGVLTGSDAFVTALNAISQLTPDQRRSTLDTIGGESIADISTSVALVGNRFNELLRQRIAVGAAGNSADPSLIAGIAGGKRGLDQVRASGQVGAEGSSFADGHADNHAGAWVQTFGGAGTLDGLNGTASIKDQSYGVAAGIDAKVAGLSIGGAFAASALDTWVEGRSATNRGTLYQGGGYVAYDDGTAYASAVGSYFSGTVTSTRQVAIGTAFQGTAIGTPKVTGYTAGGSVGYRVVVGGGVRFTPQASVQATHVERDAFTETGAGVLSLSAARDVRTLYTATAEGRLSYLSAAPGGIVEPYVGAGAAFAFGDLNTLSANRFTGAPTGTGAFSVTGARLSPTTALVNGGIEAHPNDRVTLGMGVEGRLSNRQRDGRVELHVRLGF